MQKADSHRMDFCEMPFMKLSLKFVDSFQFCLKSGKNKKKKLNDNLPPFTISCKDWFL